MVCQEDGLELPDGGEWCGRFLSSGLAMTHEKEPLHDRYVFL
jgi:hypothetical protein